MTKEGDAELDEEEAGEEGQEEQQEEERGEKSAGKERRNRRGEEEEEEEQGLGRRQSGRKRRRIPEEEEDEDTEDRRRVVDKTGGGGGGNADDDDGDEEEDDDDDDANADLSLRIVAKAEQRWRKKRSGSAAELGYAEDEVNTARIVVESGAEETMEDGAFVEGHDEDGGGDGRNLVVEEEVEVEEGEVIEVAGAGSRSETPEEGELQEDADGNSVLAAELQKEAEGDSEGRGKKKKKRKKEKKKKQKGNSDKSRVIEVKDGEAEESMVMRKLLRGPRYFDPPEEQGQSCFNCGKVGHLAAACPDGPRLKPCYVCGAFGHDGRDCPQKTECYVCGKVGHIAKNCPNKGPSRIAYRDGDSICLLCGRPGHEASTCYHSYDEQDLAQVQCYVCRDFGHLCCVVVADTWPLPISCFDCGDMGHTGAGCARPRRNDRDRGTASVCFKCGEEGHFARGCSKRNAPWPAPWPAEAQGGGYSGNDRYQPRSAGREPRSAGRMDLHWMDLREREPRWTPSRRVSSGDRWTDGSLTVDVSNEDPNSYLGPIEKFAPSMKDGYHKRRKRSGTLAR